MRSGPMPRRAWFDVYDSSGTLLASRLREDEDEPSPPDEPALEDLPDTPTIVHWQIG
jgi:hypothetical protein